MHKIKSETTRKIFQNKFRKPAHKYPANISKSNCRYHHLNCVSLNTEFHLEAPLYAFVRKHLRETASRTTF